MAIDDTVQIDVKTQESKLSFFGRVIEDNPQYITIAHHTRDGETKSAATIMKGKNYQITYYEPRTDNRD